MRVTTLVPDGADIDEADAALGRFIAPEVLTSQLEARAVNCALPTS